MPPYGCFSLLLLFLNVLMDLLMLLKMSMTFLSFFEQNFVNVQGLFAEYNKTYKNCKRLADDYKKEIQSGESCSEHFLQSKLNYSIC